MRVIRVAILLLLFGCLSISLSSTSGLLVSQSQISSFGTIDYSSVMSPVKIFLSDFSQKAISDMGTYYKVLISYDTSMRPQYPNAKIIPWVGFGEVWAGWGLNEARSGDYVLKDMYGNEITFVGYDGGIKYLVDPWNKNYQNWLGQECKRIIDKFGVDGIFADGGSVTYFYPRDLLGRVINPRTGQPYTEHDYALGHADLAKTVKSYIGTDKILIGNGGAHTGQEGWAHFEDYKVILAELDGGMAEAIITGWGVSYPDENGWLRELEWIKWHTSQPKLFLPWVQGGEASYIVGSYLLAAVDFDRVYMGHGAGGDWFANIKNWFSVDFGVAEGDYKKRADGSGVYERDFTKAKVLVNPTSTSYKINIEGNYQTIDGHDVSAVTMNAYTGMVLVKKSSP